MWSPPDRKPATLHSKQQPPAGIKTIAGWKKIKISIGGQLEPVVGTMYSDTGDVTWFEQDGHLVQQALCMRPHTLGQERPAPDSECECGVYVAARVGEPAVKVYSHEQSYMVEVRVEGWGKILEHGREGWRCEWVGITGVVDTGELARALASQYKLPLLDSGRNELWDEQAVYTLLGIGGAILLAGIPISYAFLKGN